jgi:hypothetical protein
MIDKVAVGQVFLRVLRFSPVNIIPPLLQTHLHLNTTLIGMANGRRLGTFKQNNTSLISGKIWLIGHFIFRQGSV